ncbi:TIGR02452 family protein [Sphingomonas sp. G-3-2-10]|uniref:TIGR02452 family protein n=1 Tax=Sphingomonas sp. G-3-2-10 TaxID=2728838 RepID=UPI00146BDBE3|nr:TIGR02452 family protein [Sphingomonas sp. G-3-2-10]NML04983.1 TIGR02452 family protein [Sphingomonas sp. G-3-2-10]
MNRSARVALSEETLAIVERGTYATADGASVSIRDAVDRAVANTELFRDGDFPERIEPERRTGRTRFELTGETTLEAAERLAGEGVTDPFVLNFASAKNPGGGFLSGSQAQEESLARASALYASQNAKFEFYDHNRAGSSCLYSDWMIYSPGVPVFRRDDGRLLDQPYFVSFLTSPAVNAGAVAQNEPQRVGEVALVNRERARKLLWLANRKRHEVLVLGAWGCGVFRNDPARVSALFHDLLTGEFAGCFEHVVMAVYDITPDRHVHAAFAGDFASA